MTTEKAAPARGLGGAAAWTLADQAVSSLTNVALSIVVARLVTSDEFGGFSVALIAFSFAIGLLRAIVCEPQVISAVKLGPRGRARAAREATGTAVSLGLVGALICTLVAIPLTPEARWSLWGLALTLPGILVQDTMRFIFFSARRPHLATVIDVVWAVAQFTGIAVLIGLGFDGLFWFVLAWGGAAGLSGLLGLFLNRTVPRPLRTVAWWRRQHNLSSRLAMDYLILMGLVNLAYFLVGAILGLRALGALRGTQVLLGPLQLISSSITAFALPLFSRISAGGRSVLWPSALTSAGAGLIAIGWGLALLILPDSIGTMLLGETWALAKQVLPQMSVVYIAISAATGALIGLKSMTHSGTVLGVTLIQAPLFLLLGTLGAQFFGLSEAAVGMAVAQVIGTAVAWFALLHRSRSHFEAARAQV